MGAVAVAERVSVCVSCGAEFADRSRTSPRSFCYECRPVKSMRDGKPELVVVPGEAFTLPHFREWSSGLELDTGDLWVLEPFQESFVSDWLAGFTECWLVVPEGNGKTTLMAAMGLYHCQFRRRAAVALAASSREQAEVAYTQAEVFAENSESLKGVFRCYGGHRRIVCAGQKSRLQVKAADDRTGDGIIPTLCLVDELHRHRDLKLYRTWRSKLRKLKGQIVTISTAGEPGSEFEETRERIRQTGVVERDGSFVRAATEKLVLHEWAVAEGADVEDVEVVKAANPLRHVTVDLLRESLESPSMTLDHWRRFACNIPTRGGNPAVTEAEWFDAVVKDEIPELAPIWLGLDLAFKYDTTALVPMWWRDDEYRLLGEAVILEPPRDGNSLDPHLIEEAIQRIHARNPIHTVVMDPSKAEQMAQWISETIGAVVVERAQTNSFACVDYAKFMEALRLGWLHHTGDPGLSRHVFNAVAKLLPGGDTRFDRPVEGRRSGQQRVRVVDALTAASMVHSEAALNADRPRVPLVAWA